MKKDDIIRFEDLLTTAEWVFVKFLVDENIHLKEGVLLTELNSKIIF